MHKSATMCVLCRKKSRNSVIVQYNTNCMSSPEQGHALESTNHFIRNWHRPNWLVLACSECDAQPTAATTGKPCGLGDCRATCL